MTVEEAVGSYVHCGALVVILGVTGVFGRCLGAIPQAVVMGMLAGALRRFETDVFHGVVKAPVVVGPAVVAWLVTSRLRSRFAPPVAAALIVGGVSALAGGLDAGSVIPIGVTLPEFYRPHFTLTAFLSLTAPWSFWSRRRTRRRSARCGPTATDRRRTPSRYQRGSFRSSPD